MTIILPAESAFRNGSLQGAYLMIAARAMGLDVGPMSGFDPKGVEETFFPNSTVKVNFLCNLGQGDPSAVFERSPRPCFRGCLHSCLIRNTAPQFWLVIRHNKHVRLRLHFQMAPIIERP
jgi:hypothetical protein